MDVRSKNPGTKYEEVKESDGEFDISSYYAPLSITLKLIWFILEVGSSYICYIRWARNTEALCPAANVWQYWFKGEHFEKDANEDELGHWQEPEVLLRLDDPSEGKSIGKLFICYHCSFEWDDFNILKSHIRSVHIPLLKGEAEVSHQPELDASNESETLMTNNSEPKSPNGNKEEKICLSSSQLPLHADISKELTDRKISGKKKKIVECPHCDFSCAKPKTLSKHISLKHKDVKSYECTFCQFSSFYPKVLKRHIRSKHPFVKPYSCSQCIYSSYEECDLKVHVINEHTNKLLHNCPHCGYVSSQCSALMAHIKGKHPQENFSQCPHCNKKSFDSLYSEELKIKEGASSPNLISQNNYNSPKPNRVHGKIHQCPECDYCTRQLAHLKRHIISNHTFERPYQCLHCIYSTARSDHLRKHVINKHAHENTFHCTHCSFTSPHATDLKLHIKLAHADNNNAFISFDCYLNTLRQSIDKCFKCSQCNYITCRQDNLRRHLTAHHTSVKCYQCSFCCFRTYRFDKLKNHTDARHSVGNYSTQESFSWKPYLELYNVE